MITSLLNFPITVGEGSTAWGLNLGIQGAAVGAVAHFAFRRSWGLSALIGGAYVAAVFLLWQNQIRGLQSSAVPPGSLAVPLP